MSPWGGPSAHLKAGQKAQEAYEELLAYAQQHQLPRLISLTLNHLAILVLQQSNDRPRARAWLQEAWRVVETSQDQRVLAETEWNLAQITSYVWEDPERAFPHGEHALSLARASRDQELEARSLSSLGLIQMLRGAFKEATHALEASLALYAHLRHEQGTSRELSVAPYLLGAPLTQPLTNRATEAQCCGLLAFVQVNAGQVQQSLRNGRRAVALAQESKNGWAHIHSALGLTYGLLEAGAYEEALGLTQHAIALARTLPPTVIFHRLLAALGTTYQALQRGEEAYGALEEAEAVATTLHLGPFRIPTLTRLCMNAAEAGQWETAYTYALQALALRKSYDAALIVWDFYRHYETEALVRGGDERQARAEVQRLGEGLASNQRFRIPYLRSLAVLAAWEGRREQIIGHLRAAAQVAADLGVPAEQWQIQVALGREYEAAGQPAQARAAFGEAARIIQRLTEGIEDEVLRTHFLAGPQIQQVLREARSEASPVRQPHAKQRR